MATLIETEDFIVEKYEEAGEEPVYSLFVVQREITIMFNVEDWNKLRAVFQDVDLRELRETINIQ